MKNIKENKGITLIALIITIIVLIILAVVAISAVQGDGIIAHAKNARDDYQTAQEEENVTLSKYVSLMDNLGKEEEGNDEYEFTLNQLIDSNVLKVYEDEYEEFYDFYIEIEDLNAFFEEIGATSFNSFKNEKYYFEYEEMPFFFIESNDQSILSRSIFEINNEIDKTDEQQIYCDAGLNEIEGREVFQVDFSRYDISGDKLTSLVTDGKFPTYTDFLNVYGNKKLHFIDISEYDEEEILDNL